MLDRASEGRVAMDQARQLNLDIGRREAAALCLWDLAWLERLDGNYPRELDALEAAAPEFPGITRLFAAARALCLAKLDRLDEAGAALEASEGDLWSMTVQRAEVARARLSVARGHVDDALREADVGEANIRASGLEWVNAAADALIETGVVAALAGAAATAQRRGAEALEIAERKRNLALAQKARALLAGDLSRL